MNKLKILFLDHISLLSGGEKSLLDILVNIDKDIFEPILVCPSEGPLTIAAREAGVKVIISEYNSNLVAFNRSKYNLRKLLISLSSLGKPIKDLINIVKKENCDIIYTNSMKSHFIGSIVAKLTGKKLVWHVRDILEEGFLLKTFNFFAKYPNEIICISKAVESQFKNSIQSKKVIYNGLAPYNTEENKDSSSEFRSNDQDFIIGLVGQIAKWKGQEIFIKSGLELLKNNRNYKFVIVGDALFEKEKSYKAYIENLVKDEKRIIFTGYRKDVRQIIRGFDLLVHASVKPEPFGRVIIEAMEAGIPVIATNIGGPTEIIIDGFSGLLYCPESKKELIEKIEMLNKNKGLLTVLGENGKKRYQENFLLETTIRKIEKTLIDLTK